MDWQDKQEAIPGAGYGAQLGQAAQNSLNKPRSIAMAAERHAKLLSMVHERVRSLAQRLDPVLRPVGPTESAKPNGHPGGPQAPIATALHEISNELERVDAMLADLQDRLEL